MGFLSDKAEKLTPYIPGEQPKDGAYIKLNTNENPYPPSPKAIEAIKNAAGERLKLYPDPESVELREIYAKYIGLHNISTENVFVGNGSDEVLSIAFQAFFMGRENVFMPEITYSFYPVYCTLYDIKAKEIPLADDFQIKVSDYKQKNDGVIIANPNAPTSRCLELSAIEEIAEANRESVILIDEAYIDFGGESAVSLVQKYNNLLVVSTLSKSRSLAGLRVGFAVGSKELIDGMNRVKNSINSYPVDLLAQQGAAEAIKDTEYFEECRDKIIKTRDWTSTELIRLGFDVLPSKANFLFIENEKKSAEEIFQRLKEKKILVRYFNKPKIDNRLRVSIGTPEEMRTFIDIMGKIVAD